MASVCADCHGALFQAWRLDPGRGALSGHHARVLPDNGEERAGSYVGAKPRRISHGSYQL